MKNREREICADCHTRNLVARVRGSHLGNLNQLAQTSHFSDAVVVPFFKAKYGEAKLVREAVSSFVSTASLVRTLDLQVLLVLFLLPDSERCSSLGLQAEAFCRFVHNQYTMTHVANYLFADNLLLFENELSIQRCVTVVLSNPSPVSLLSVITPTEVEGEKELSTEYAAFIETVQQSAGAGSMIPKSSDTIATSH